MNLRAEVTKRDSNLDSLAVWSLLCAMRAISALGEKGIISNIYPPFYLGKIYIYFVALHFMNTISQIKFHDCNRISSLLSYILILCKPNRHGVIKISLIQ